MEDVKELCFFTNCGSCVLNVSILVLMEDVKELKKALKERIAFAVFQSLF